MEEDINYSVAMVPGSRQRMSVLPVRWSLVRNTNGGKVKAVGDGVLFYLPDALR